MTGDNAVETAEKRAFSRNEVVGIIQSVVKNVQPGTPVDKELIEQIHAISDSIDHLRKEISFTGQEIEKMHLTTATDELDAVVAATETAAGQIMDSCDAINTALSEGGDGVNTKVGAAVTQIFEACSFQDITGQRLGKVIKTLKGIEENIKGIMAIVGESPRAATKPETSNQSAPSDKDLLNGPALPGQGITQEDIDKLLDDF